MEISLECFMYFTLKIAHRDPNTRGPPNVLPVTPAKSAHAFHKDGFGGGATLTASLPNNLRILFFSLVFLEDLLLSPFISHQASTAFP